MPGEPGRVPGELTTSVRREEDVGEHSLVIEQRGGGMALDVPPRHVRVEHVKDPPLEVDVDLLHGAAALSGPRVEKPCASVDLGKSADPVRVADECD